MSTAMQTTTDTRLAGKLVLFGAGKSGGLFLEQNPELEILAVADNDVTRHGSSFHGHPLIAATQIADLDCDAIVITSVWSSSILTQLGELGLGHIPTIIPGKREMKGMRDVHPFSQPETKQLARELVLFLHALTDANGIDLHLDFGTLLGAVRDHDFIAWDDDIDFSIVDHQFDAAIALVSANRHLLPQADRVVWSIELISAHGRGVVLRLTCNNLDGSERLIPFETDLIRREPRDGYAVAIGSMPEWYCPLHHFQQHDSIEVFGQTLKAPHDALGYLDFVYGNWRTPRKDMAFADYAHAGEVPFGQFETTTHTL